jgi:DNA-binding IscR family transcriptional regulator
MDCSIRALWTIVQQAVNQILSNVSIADLTVTEEKTGSMLNTLLEQNLINVIETKS